MDQHTIPSMRPPLSPVLLRPLQVLRWQLVDLRAMPTGTVLSVVTVTETTGIAIADHKPSGQRSVFPKDSPGCETSRLACELECLFIFIACGFGALYHMVFSRIKHHLLDIPAFETRMSLQELQVCILHDFTGFWPLQD